MNYTLNQLRIYVKISELQSVTKAAEVLHLTQPAVSIQLKNFQNQFDIPLTEVIGRKLYVTDFGKEIAETATNILNLVNTIDHKTLAYKGHLTGRLKISVVSTGKYVMPYFLSDFIKQHPGIDLIMDVTNKSAVIKSLESNEVDFSLVSIIPNHFPVEKIDLLDNTLHLVGNKKAPKGKHSNLKQTFEEQPLIFREDGSGTRQAMEQFIAMQAVNPVKKMELTSNEAVKQAVLAGLGYSIMPLIGIKNELANGEMHIIPARGLPIKTVWQLIWLKGKRLSPVAQAFLDHIQTEKTAILERYFPEIDDL